MSLSTSYDDNLRRFFLEENKRICNDLMITLEATMSLKHWGFYHTYSRVLPDGDALPKVIYNSEWCRVRFNLEGGDLHNGFTMSVWYGRSHAPDEKSIITWNKEKCWCWHRINEALNFLDGLSPQESINQLDSKGQWLPDIPWQFIQSSFSQKISPTGYPSPTFVASMHAVIWEHYRHRLFELFDLRQYGLWERYKQYIIEYHKLKGSTTNPDVPAYDKIC